MRLSRPFALCCLAWFIGSLILFLVGIGQPAKLNFDEFHYIPAAKQVIAWQEPRNSEHPPLGKILIAQGVMLFGDNPLGWRFMSALFGSITLVGMLVWAHALFGGVALPSVVATLSLANQLLFVQARIAMLDTFMFAFLAWGLAFFFWSWMREELPRKQQLRLLTAAGVCFGLATASKWAAVVPWAACIAAVLAIRLLQHWGTRFDSKRRSRDEPAEPEFYSATLWKGLRLREWGWALFGAGLVAYYATFLPYLWVERTAGQPGYGFFDIFLKMQREMFGAQLRVTQDHPYMSHWQDWAILKRPIWYAYEREPNDESLVRGVILLGNPWIMWGGLLAWGYACWAWFRDRSRIAFLIVFSYAVLYFGWAVIPRKVSFYYYYYPAGMTLSLALAYVAYRFRSARARVGQYAFLAFCVATFLYFYPILAALKIPAESFRRWMWFSSWI